MKKSAYNKFAKTEEHASWAIRRRILLKIKAWRRANGEVLQEKSEE